jgi:hypothetical protein
MNCAIAPICRPVEQGLADRIAEEASLRMWHMRLVESFVAVTGQYVREKPTVERFAETLLLLRDTLVLIKGENPFPRPRLGAQVAYLDSGNTAVRQRSRHGLSPKPSSSRCGPDSRSPHSPGGTDYFLNAVSRINT